MTFYLADTENVANRWSAFVDSAIPGDEFWLFFTKNVGPAPLSLFAPGSLKHIAFVFVECSSGENALDFQLSTQLGYLVAQNPDAHFIIISRDADFDNAVHYWQSRGVDVRRDAACPLPGHGPAQPVSEPHDATHLYSVVPACPADKSVLQSYKDQLAIAGVAREDMPRDLDIIYKAMRGPKNRRKLSVLNGFTRAYGRADGCTRYGALKPVIEKIIENGPVPYQGSAAPSANSDAAASGQPAPKRTPALPAGAATTLTLAEQDLLVSIRTINKNAPPASAKKLMNILSHARGVKNQSQALNIYRRQLSQSFGPDYGPKLYQITNCFVTGKLPSETPS